MRYKFNPFERAVGFFLLSSVLGSVAIGAGLAIKKNWFEEKITFHTHIKSAENLREGSSVLMSGLKVGRIDRIDLDESQQILVKFSILKKYHSQITPGTTVQFTRPFVIGDKVLTLIQGPYSTQALKAESKLALHESFDLMDVLKGKRLETTIAKIDSILTNLEQTVQKTNAIASTVGDDKQMKATLKNLHLTIADFRSFMPHLTNRLPHTIDLAEKTLSNLETITSQVREEGPQGSTKVTHLIEESIITLQGIQKNYFLRSNVEEARKEMAKQKNNSPKETNREPAAQ